MAGYIVKRSNLSDQVMEAVVHELSVGSLAPGQRVTEQGLARRLNVSRTPIREALGRLVSQGTLQARAGGGYVVPLPTPSGVRDIIAVRRLLEPYAIRIAAETFGHEEIEAISRAIKHEAAAISAKSAARFAKANAEFRAAIFQPIANKALRAAIAQFDTHLQLIRSSTLADTELRRQIVTQQKAILDAIKAHDAALAERLWISYLEESGRELVSALVNSAPPKDDSEG